MRWLVLISMVLSGCSAIGYKFELGDRVDSNRSLRCFYTFSSAIIISRAELELLKEPKYLIKLNRSDIMWIKESCLVYKGK